MYNLNRKTRFKTILDSRGDGQEKGEVNPPRTGRNSQGKKAEVYHVIYLRQGFRRSNSQTNKLKDKMKTRDNTFQ